MSLLTYLMLQVAPRLDFHAEAKSRKLDDFSEDNLVDTQFVQLPKKVR